MAALQRPGVWRFAGMSGIRMGVDLAEAMASLPNAIDRELARELLIAAEVPWLAAAYETTDKDQG